MPCHQLTERILIILLPSGNNGEGKNDVLGRMQMEKKSDYAEKNEKWGQKYLVVVNRQIVLKTNDFAKAKAAFLKHAKEGNKYTNLINTTVEL